MNGDGIKDLACLFNKAAANFSSSDIEGVLQGQTVDGAPIMGRDSVSIAGL